jgi:hypothetical protein
MYHLSVLPLLGEVMDADSRTEDMGHVGNRLL